MAGEQQDNVLRTECSVWLTEPCDGSLAKSGMTIRCLLIPIGTYSVQVSEQRESGAGLSQQ